MLRASLAQIKKQQIGGEERRWHTKREGNRVRNQIKKMKTEEREMQSKKWRCTKHGEKM